MEYYTTHRVFFNVLGCGNCKRMYFTRGERPVKSFDMLIEMLKDQYWIVADSTYD